jgi:hypothetical protein
MALCLAGSGDPGSGDGRLHRWSRHEGPRVPPHLGDTEGGGRLIPRVHVHPLEEDQYSGWAFLHYSFLRANVLYVEFVSDEPFKEKESTASAAAARATLERALRSTPEILEEYVVCMKTASRDKP